MTLVTTRRAALVAVCAAGLVLGTAGTAHAKGNTETVRLVPPDHSPDADADGKVKVVRRRKGDKMVVRVKHLAPKTVFEVRDAVTDEALGTLRTNRRGKGRLVLSEGNVGQRSKTAAVDTLPDDVEIVEEGDNQCVLEMEGAGSLIGEAHYTGALDHEAFITLLSFPAGDLPGPPGPPDDVPRPAEEMAFADVECFLLSLAPPAESDATHALVSYELTLDSVSGDEMPLGVPSAADLAERAFEIRDGGGDVWIAGNLPAVEEVSWDVPEMPDMPDIPGPPDGWDGGWAGPPDRGDRPVFLGPPIRLDTADEGDEGSRDRPDDGTPGDRPGGGDGGWIPDFRGDDWFFPEPEISDVTIWIADESGVLTEAGNLLRFEMPAWDCPPPPEWDDRPGDGGGPGRPEPGDDAPTRDGLR